MIYLDQAATSFPKPRSVINEQMRCMRLYCGNPGRGSHKLALASAKKIFECRTLICDMFGSDCPQNVCFTMNTTMALNIAIKGLLKDGDHVLISDMEHNAVYRPISRLAADGRITYDIFPTYTADRRRSSARICSAIARLIRPNTRMVICSHVPNICSAVLPISEIGALCKKKGIIFVVDAAQSAGHLPINIEKMNIDVLCAPGHKGLLGPQGTGFVLWGKDIEADTLIEGGSGYQSLDPHMPTDLPERFEAGTLPTPAIAGLCEGIKEVGKIGIDQIHDHEIRLHQRLQSILESFDDITVYPKQYHGSVLLFSSSKYPSDQIGEELDRRGFCVRTGFHCSALGHRTLQTQTDGAVRVSFGINNKVSDIDAFGVAMREIFQ